MRFWNIYKVIVLHTMRLFSVQCDRDALVCTNWLLCVKCDCGVYNMTVLLTTCLLFLLLMSLYFVLSVFCVPTEGYVCTVSFLLWTVFCVPSEGYVCTISVLLCTVSFLLCTVFCVLCTYLRIGVYCLLFTVFSVLCSVYLLRDRCVLSPFYCVLCSVYCVPTEG